MEDIEHYNCECRQQICRVTMKKVVKCEYLETNNDECCKNSIKRIVRMIATVAN